MALSEGITQTQNIETLQEPQLIHWSNNYELRLAHKGSENTQEYEESAVFVNPNGSWTFTTATLPITHTPETPAFIASTTDDEALRTLETGLEFDAAFLQNPFRQPLAKQALKNIGYDLNRNSRNGIKTSETTTPGIEGFNQAMSYLRDKTGFAPELVGYNGGFFPARDMVENFNEGKVLVGSDILNRSHDMCAHIAFWAVVPEEAFKTSADRGLRLLRTFESIDRAASPVEYYESRNALNTYYDQIEDLVTAYNLGRVGEMESLPETSNIHYEVARNLSELMYGKNATEEEQAHAADLSLEMPKRLRILADMPELSAAA
jgi:hypothetical protein